MSKPGKFFMALLAAGMAAATLASYVPLPSPDARLLITMRPQEGGTLEEEESAGASSAQENGNAWLDMSAERLHGVWIGELPVQVTRKGEIMLVKDRAVLNFDIRSDPRLLISQESLDRRYLPTRSWQMADNALTFLLNDSPWRATVTLRFADDSTLVGTYEQYGVTRDLTMTRSSYEPGRANLPTGFFFEGKYGQEWLDQLASFPQYTPSASPIGFTYDLMKPEHFRSAADAYGLGQMLDNMRYAGLSDVERMKRMLDFVSDNFMHDGAAQVSEADLDPLQAVQYCQRNGAIECRGLSAILAEMLRIDGIPAKPVMCIPTLEPSEDCHVVVHAYSASLGQWIMLDPTHHLVLRNAGGQYVSLPMLRQALISGETLIPNSDAGHNDMPFSIEYYRAYMAKNTFRFSCLRDNSFNAQTSKSNKTIMLTPEGWTVPYRWSRPETVITSADDFWVPPSAEQLEEVAKAREAAVAPPAGSIAPEEALAADPNADIFVLNGVMYRYAADVDWVMQMDLFAVGRWGSVMRTGVTMGFQDWDATVLPVGAAVYASSGGDGILLAEKGGLLYPYLRQTEG